MTVFVDDMRLKATVGSLTARWSHLTVGPGEDLAELHAFAASIGLRRSWFQGPPEHRHPHYDVTDTKRRQAIKAGAKPITWREAGEQLAEAAKSQRAAADLAAEPAAGKRDENEHPCTYRSCGRLDTRPYQCGGRWRCPDHTPSALAGQPEPDSARYCLAICYCGQCPHSGRAPAAPIRDTVVDFRHIASGKRREPDPGRYREAQAQVAVRTPPEVTR